MAEWQISDELKVFVEGGWCSLFFTAVNNGVQDVAIGRMNPDTVACLQPALSSGVLPWENRDKSLQISRIGGRLNLTYNLDGPPGSISLTLDRDQEKRLRDAISAAGT